MKKEITGNIWSWERNCIWEKTGQLYSRETNTRIYSPDGDDGENARTIVARLLRLSLSWRVPCLTRQKKEFGKLTVPSSFQWQII